MSNPLQNPDQAASRVNADRASSDLANRLWTDMRERWERGAPRPVEDYLADSAIPLDDINLRLDLVYGEFALREQAGERPVLAEYILRFPELKEPLTRQIELHAALTEASTRMHLGPTFISDVPEDTAAPDNLSRDVPAQIGKYRIVTRLGAGGQATVYRAVHPTLGIDLAIKISHHQLQSGSASAQRLATEGRILAELRHPNLARVYDLDQDRGHPFVVMEFVPGRAMEQLVRQDQPEPREAARLVGLVARAVEHAHARGALHLDIKPANVLVSPDGTPRLIDFGLGQFHTSWAERPVETVEVSGTLAYLPPERAAGTPGISFERVDVFGLGGVLYFLLTGRAPFAGRNAPEIWENVRRGAWDPLPLERPEIPRPLQEICRKCLAQDPDQRFASAADVAAALEKFSPAANSSRRSVLIASGLGLLSLTGLIAGALWWRSSHSTIAPSNLNPPAVASINLRVWNGTRFNDLLRALPLQAGDEVRIEAECPAGFHTLLLWVDADGFVHKLAAGEPNATKGALAYPATGQAVPLEGRPGTQLILLCGQPDQPVSLAPLQEKLKSVHDWPKLPGSSIARLGGAGVQIENTSRGLGLPHDKPDAEAIISANLLRLQSELQPHCTVFSAIAVSHQ